jgi:hypothetical protein
MLRMHLLSLRIHACVKTRKLVVVVTTNRGDGVEPG